MRETPVPVVLVTKCVGLRLLPVERRHLCVPVVAEEFRGRAVHSDVLVGRWELRPAVPGEVRPAGDVQLIVGDVADAGLHDSVEVLEHSFDGLAWPAKDKVDAAP